MWPGSGAPPAYQYTGPDNGEIEVKNNLKDLGVQLDSDLTFKVHIEKTVAAASKLAGWGLRSFKRRSRVVMKTLWKTLVQPKMDYCSQLWSPGDQDSINKLEAVQRHFSSKVKGLEEMDYWERLQDLKILSQERRRERYKVIFLWKISQGMVGGYNVTISSNERRGRTILPNQVVASAPAAVRRARECSLGVKGARLFNLLPAHIRSMDSANVDNFKCELDVFLSMIPDQPTIPGHPRAAETNSLLHQIPLHFANVY